MSRRSSSLMAVACLTLAALSTACGRSATGPSEIPAAALEAQGSNNVEAQGSNNLMSEAQGSNNLEAQGSNN
jgi:hypothetical protein